MGRLAIRRARRWGWPNGRSRDVDTQSARGPAHAEPDIQLPDGSALGHRHLFCLLSVHGALRRHGVTQAFRELTEVQIAEALDACAYFGLHDLAATVARIPMAASSLPSAEAFDSEYRRRFALTDRVVTAIRERVAVRPNDFPLT